MRAPVVRVALIAALLVALLPSAVLAVPDQLVDRLEQAREQLADLDTRVSVAVEDYNAAKAQLEQLEAQQQRTAARVDALTDEVAGLEASTAAFVRSMYMRGPTTELGVALDGDKISDVGRDLAVMDRLSRQRQVELETLGVRRGELAAARGQLEQQVEAATAREAQLADRREQVEQLVADQRDEITGLQQRIERIEAREAAERARREREAAERAAQEAVEHAAQRAAQQAQEAEQAAPAPAPAPPPPAPEPAPAGTRAGADQAVQAALSQVGKPYQYGAAGPDSYDCSGLTMWAWQHAGVSLPHSSRMQYAATTRISRAQLQAGDLVFYGSPIHHVAMYLDGTRVVEAPYTGANVRVRNDGLLRGDIVGYGRV